MTGGAATGVVLAGGASSRFGSPKAAAQLAGRAMIEYPLAAMREAGLPAVVIAKSDSDLPALPGAVEVIREPDRPRHPLCGIVTALERIGGPIVVCACDMPFVTPELLGWLAALPGESAIVVAGGSPQPLLGRYTPAALPALREALDAESSVLRALELAGAREIDEGELSRFGEPSELIADIDSQIALQEAESKLRKATDSAAAPRR
ncbi:MAG: molybdenum cofactor guanylyltransferase [Actinobacteria bacterium]|nr:molybdenum cofactor guanylyltransferase [Actinomycetota bacterium]